MVTTHISVMSELRQIIAESSELELEDTVFELGCYFDPQRHHDIMMAIWLDQVIAQIGQSLKKGESSQFETS